jgi:ADP-ribosyl-[dinitrogen reductase] hydrolase
MSETRATLFDRIVGEECSSGWRLAMRSETRRNRCVRPTVVPATARSGRVRASDPGCGGLGEDTDTVGAVTGQIAGAMWGLTGIPTRWRDRLPEGARIQAPVLAFHDAWA